MATTLTSPTALLAYDLRQRLVRVGRTLRAGSAPTTLTPSQSAVLGLLSDGRPRLMTELARSQAVQLPTMTQAVSRLEAKGWVTRATLERDRRCVQVTITDAGRRLSDELFEMKTMVLAERLERLNETERDRLRAVLPVLDKVLE